MSDIAVVTQQNEPRTISYAWFESAGDNTEVPNHYVRGFEVYEDESALADVHRMSEPYKKMRSSVIPDKILAKPTDLRFLQPTGLGFMNRPGEPAVFAKHGGTVEKREKCLIVILEISPKDDAKSKLLDLAGALSDYAASENKEVASFWILEYLPEYSDSGIKIFLRFDNYVAYENYSKSSKVSEMMYV